MLTPTPVMPSMPLDAGSRGNCGSSSQSEVWLGLPQGADALDITRLDAADRLRLARLTHPRRRAEFAVSRALMQHAGWQATAAWSLSHSGGHAALLCAPVNTVVGIDLEQHAARDVQAIGRFAFAPAEYLALQRCAPDEQRRWFYALWVVKEALAKALRLPLLDALRQCCFVRGGKVWRSSVPTGRPWVVRVFEPRPYLSLAIACIGTTEPPSRIYEWPAAASSEWPEVLHLSSSMTSPTAGAILCESSTCNMVLPTS
jgi:hypothetical protein